MPPKTPTKKDEENQEEEEETKQEAEQEGEGDGEGDGEDDKKVAKVSASKKIKKEAPAGGKKEPTGASYKGFTTDEYKKYKENVAELSSKSQNDLKEMCKKNDQKVTGTKKELIERVAEGKVLGQLPKCTKCGGGRLKYDIKKGQYTCPGYMEDTKFVKCGAKSNKEDIKREAW
eukprot:CAMPEP_0176472644 /NCGR_PEP_ID=MMETSP0127-20121128/41864_1 /TAXON_ID=938130 /ORGANISM="Platyophrya macrostoma, Strain WH" /LENGTH=173 /DNA_ID=CAMNT_0017867549 /DNA_START=30 /DNA_END=548 /DNA_ORIENTATION=-